MLCPNMSNFIDAKVQCSECLCVEKEDEYSRNENGGESPCYGVSQMLCPNISDFIPTKLQCG